MYVNNCICQCVHFCQHFTKCSTFGKPVSFQGILTFSSMVKLAMIINYIVEPQAKVSTSTRSPSCILFSHICGHRDVTTKGRYTQARWLWLISLTALQQSCQRHRKMINLFPHFIWYIRNKMYFTITKRRWCEDDFDVVYLSPNKCVQL
jgi:hypothetical protein